jgi:hypothetical protein
MGLPENGKQNKLPSRDLATGAVAPNGGVQRGPVNEEF